MIIIFEIAPPLRLKPKLEQMGPMKRVLWLWFSVSYVSMPLPTFLDRLIRAGAEMGPKAGSNTE